MKLLPPMINTFFLSIDLSLPCSSEGFCLFVVCCCRWLLLMWIQFDQISDVKEERGQHGDERVDEGRDTGGCGMRFFMNV